MIKRKTIKPEAKPSVSVSNTVSYALQGKVNNSNSSMLLRILLTFLGFFGTVYSFISMFDMKVYDAGFIFYAVLFIAMFSAIFILPAPFLLSLIPIFGVYIYKLKENWDYYIDGFQYTINRIYSSVNLTEADYYRFTSKLSETNSTTIFLIYSGFIVALMLCFFTIVAASYNGFNGSFLVTFVLVEIGLYNGMVPNHLWFFVLICYWISMLIIKNSDVVSSQHKKNPGFIRKKDEFCFCTGKFLRTGEKCALITVICTAGIIILTAITLNVTNYQRSDELNQKRYDIKTAASEFDISDLGESMKRLGRAIIGQDTEANSKKDTPGELGKVGSINYSGAEIMDITFGEYQKSSLNTFNSMYLKSYTGSVYSNDQWDVLSDDVYKNSNYYNLLSDIKNLFSLYPQAEISKTISYNTTQSRISILITPRENFQDIYYPYAASYGGNFDYVNDTSIAIDVSKPQKYYVYNYNTFISLMQSGTIDSISYDNPLWGNYTKFATEYYTQVPDGMDELYKFYDDNLAADMSKYNLTSSPDNINDIYSALEDIKTVICANATYTLSPGETPDNRDFISYFLTENHKGYCTHFASAGAMLSRMAGIPTRYCEGFAVDGKLINENTTITVKDNSAHAWVEFYVEGLGWIPFEFTPGYSDEEESKTNVTAPKTTTAPNETHETKKHTNSTKHDTTTAPKQTTTEKAENNDFSFFSTTSIIISSIVIVLLIVGGIFIRYNYITKKRYKAMHSADYNHSATATYRYILKLLQFYGVENKNLQYMDFAALAEEKTNGLFENGEFVNATKIALMASMSDETIEKSDSDYLNSIAESISSKLHNSKKWYAKLYMKYILTLI